MVEELIRCKGETGEKRSTLHRRGTVLESGVCLLYRDGFLDAGMCGRATDLREWAVRACQRYVRERMLPRKGRPLAFDGSRLCAAEVSRMVGEEIGHGEFTEAVLREGHNVQRVGRSGYFALSARSSRDRGERIPSPDGCWKGMLDG